MFSSCRFKITMYIQMYINREILNGGPQTKCLFRIFSRKIANFYGSMYWFLGLTKTLVLDVYCSSSYLSE